MEKYSKENNFINKTNLFSKSSIFKSTLNCDAYLLLGPIRSKLLYCNGHLLFGGIAPKDGGITLVCCL